MKTVHEVSKLTGVSIRALQYYDRIDLLQPSARTEAGYRLYADADLERLQSILLFRELEFPLKQIKTILDSPGFDRNRALEQQITMLKKKKEHLQALIDHAVSIREKGATMDFTPFDTAKLDEYAAKAKAAWGDTQAYKEYEAKGHTPETTRDLAGQMMQIFAEFGQMKDLDPGSAAPQAQVKRLQDFITAHYYRCTDEILSGLGKMYAAGGEFTENIDRSGGEGTAEYANRCIQIYCK